MNSKPDISVEPLIMKSTEEKIGKSVPGEKAHRLPAGRGRGCDQSIGELIDKVSATSIAEIEKLVSELQAVRNYLKVEGDRIQQEMARYAHLSDMASASVKIVAESIGQWRKVPPITKTDNVSHSNSYAH